MRLKEKVALVTGAASGIGKSTALLFGQEGARVMCADLNGEGAEQTAREIVGAGGQAASVRADVSREEDVRRMVGEVVARWGRLDVLFNNAGMEFALPVTQTPVEQWDQLMGVNLRGVFLGCKHAVPEMIKQGGGAIVNTASVVGLVAAPSGSAYCASKGGVVLLTKSLAVELASFNIRVNAVCPGVIRTPMVERAVEMGEVLTGSREESWRMLAKSQPIGRMGEPEEVARAVLFLASDEASLITGVALPVDGGWSAALASPWLYSS